MFTIKEIFNAGFHCLQLANPSGTCTATIIPACGAILHSFCISKNHSILNVISGYTNKADYDENLTAHGFKSCKLAPFACRINKGIYTFRGKEYKTSRFYLGQNAIHGLIYDAAFSVVSQCATESFAEVVLLHQYRKNDPGYPFDFDCTVTYRLEKNNRLLISTSISNQHDSEIPVQDGWHPYFTLHKPINELELMLATTAQVEFDEELIPTGNMLPYTKFYNGKLLGDTRFDDCFKLDMNKEKICTITDHASGLQVEIKPGNSYPFIQLYTPPDRRSIAVENLSAPPDCFNNGIHLKVLAPGESASFITSFIIRSV